MIVINVFEMWSPMLLLALAIFLIVHLVKMFIYCHGYP